MPSSRFEEIADQVRNWGRWGEADERGTLNFIDDAALRRGLASIVSGESFQLGLGLSEAEGVQAGFIEGRDNPRREMINVNTPLSPDPDWICSNEDSLTMGIQASTHWDAIAHVSYRGKLYNGFPASSVTEAGAARCGIDKVGSLVTRAVLLDVARALGLDYLEPGHAISPSDLDAALALAQCHVEPGDLVLVRSGQMHYLHLDDEQPKDLVAYTWPTPGLSVETAKWFHHHDVAAVGIDSLVLEVFPGEREEDYLPVHLLHLAEMGMLQGQNFLLDPLARACAADGRYCMFIDATPLKLTGGLGSPVNPVVLR
ncbi:MAG: cyclase family protein [Actinobacteria bacterium]|nr:cyclase family protein [Actinomycetota bacterium]